MFKILCLTTGSEIRWPKQYYGAPQKIIPAEVMQDIAHFEDTQVQGGIIYFNTEEQASWFIKRRLSYNPRRTDAGKLNFMNAVFTTSGMEDIHVSKSHQFQLISC